MSHGQISHAQTPTLGGDRFPPPSRSTLPPKTSRVCANFGNFRALAAARGDGFAAQASGRSRAGRPSTSSAALSGTSTRT